MSISIIVAGLISGMLLVASYILFKSVLFN